MWLGREFQSVGAAKENDHLAVASLTDGLKRVARNEDRVNWQFVGKVRCKSDKASLDWIREVANYTGCVWIESATDAPKIANVE